MTKSQKKLNRIIQVNARYQEQFYKKKEANGRETANKVHYQYMLTGKNYSTSNVIGRNSNQPHLLILV